MSNPDGPLVLALELERCPAARISAEPVAFDAAADAATAQPRRFVSCKLTNYSCLVLIYAEVRPDVAERVAAGVGLVRT